MKTKIDYDSTVNQDIKEKFANNEVKANVSYEMTAMLEAANSYNHQRHDSAELPTFEDIENYYESICPDCGETLEYDEQGVCPSCGSEMLDKDVDQQPQEIYQWFIVSEYLFKKLKDHGEPVLEYGCNYYWGRTCCGQSIALDSVISSICEEMQILDGQKHSWAGK